MVPIKSPGLRPHRSRLATMSAFGLIAGSFALALLPLAAFANTGNVIASENCQSWSAKVDLDHNVEKTHLVDVVLSTGFSTPGFLGKSFDTRDATLPTTVWADEGNAPFTGTVTLIIHNPNGSIESTQSKTIKAPTGCHPDAVATRANPATGVVGTSGTFADTATISSADHPGGNVSFGLYSDAGCTTAVNGVAGSGTISNGTAFYSASWTPSAAGLYYWKASYAGDANNTGFTECGGLNEAVTVTDAPATGTLGTTTTPTPTTTTPAGGVQAASTTAPGLPTAGHPSLGLAPASSRSDLVRNTLLALLVLAGAIVAGARLVLPRGGKVQA